MLLISVIAIHCVLVLCDLLRVSGVRYSTALPLSIVQICINEKLVRLQS